MVQRFKGKRQRKMKKRKMEDKKRRERDSFLVTVKEECKAKL